MPPKKATATAASAAGKKRKAVEETTAPPSKRANTTTRKAAAPPKKAPAAAAPKKKAPAAAATKKKAPVAAATKKTAPDTAATEKKTPAAATTSKKRKATEEVESPAKRAKSLTKGPVINEAPSTRLNAYVFGTGDNGELGLGTVKNGKEVKRPRLNPYLAGDKAGVVQIEAGGMHTVALTHDNKILTWGVNDQGALGRDTTWTGGTKDMNDDSSDSGDDDDDNGLNPHESTPAEVDWSTTELAPETRFTQVTAGDSCSFALTDDGRVYGWGTFRGKDGIIGFTPEVYIATRPVLIKGLSNVVSIKTGENHCYALDKAGKVYSWGDGGVDQLGRRVIERSLIERLKPRPFGLPTGAKKGIVRIETGANHGFALAKNGEVYSWGLNNFGETGIMTNAGENTATIRPAQVIDLLKGKKIVSIQGGAHHSLAATKEGDCLVWGRIDGSQMGVAKEELPDEVTMKDERNKPRILKVPTKVSTIKGAVAKVAAASDHSFAITKDGKAYSWGFSTNYQTGQGVDEDITVASMMDNNAIRDQKIISATAGGQFGLITSAFDVEMTNGV